MGTRAPTVRISTGRARRGGDNETIQMRSKGPRSRWAKGVFARLQRGSSPSTSFHWFHGTPEGTCRRHLGIDQREVQPVGPQYAARLSPPRSPSPRRRGRCAHTRSLRRASAPRWRRWPPRRDCASSRCWCAGSGLSIASNVAPHDHRMPSVVRMKYCISFGRRQGNALSRPITRLRVIAQISASTHVRPRSAP